MAKNKSFSAVHEELLKQTIEKEIELPTIAPQPHSKRGYRNVAPKRARSGRPKLLETSGSEISKSTIYLTDLTKSDLQKKSQEMGWSTSEIVRELITRYIHEL